MPTTTPPSTTVLPRNALLVCAGTVTCYNVGGMGSGFAVFKRQFGYTSGQEKASTGGWAFDLQQHLTAYKTRHTSLPAYMTMDRATGPNGLLGGIATVPCLPSTGLAGKCTDRPELERQYKEAVYNAVKAALALGRPLHIQPLGIGVYGWSPERAAELFAEAITTADPLDKVQISIPIHDQTAGSNDQRFKNRFNARMQEIISRREAPPLPDVGAPQAAVMPPNPMIPLEAVNLVPPTVRDGSMPISDHKMMIQNTRYGAMATYNMLCPGTPVAGVFGAAIGTLPGNRAPVNDKVRMELTAQYIYESFKQGIGLLALQEVPGIDSPDFVHLENALRAINNPPLFDVAELRRQWSNTSGGSTRQGTVVLWNPNRFTLTPHSKQTIVATGVKGGATYEFTDNGTGEKFRVANVHGSGNRAEHQATMDYIERFDGIVFSDTNVTSVSADHEGLRSVDQPSMLVSGKRVKLNTYDCIQDNISRKRDPRFIPDVSGIKNPPLLHPVAPKSESVVFEVDKTKAMRILAQFSESLGNPPGTRIASITLRTPAGSPTSQITISNADLAQKFQAFQAQLKRSISSPPKLGLGTGPQGKQDLLVKLDQLIANIEEKKNGRWTSGLNSNKVNHLKAVREDIGLNYDDDTDYDRYVSRIKTICDQKRHWFSLNAPHSASEFLSLFSQKNEEKQKEKAITPNSRR